MPAGGAIKALQDNVSFLKEHGHQIDIYTTDTSNYSFAPLKEYSDNYYIFPVKRSKFRKIIFSLVEKFVPSRHFDDNSRVFIAYNDFKNTQKKIAKEIDSKNYDLVLLEQDSIFSLSPAILKYLKTLKVYFCQQPSRNNERILMNLNNLDNRPFHLKIYDKLFEEKYLKLDVEYAQFADYILCNSYFSHENILKSYGMNSIVSYLGVNTNQFKALNLPRKNIVLSVGSISPRKGFDFVIKSISKVDKSIRPKFLIVGYSKDKKWIGYLKSLSDELGVELEILSGISYDDLIKLYNEVKLVVFTPYIEPFGLVPLESFACGTPVIGVKEGGVRETVKSGENGLLIDREENAFGKGIEELLTNRELWDKCSNYGPIYVDEFWTLNHAGERLLTNLYDILENFK